MSDMIGVNIQLHNSSIWKPIIATIEKIVLQTEFEKLYRLKISDPKEKEKFKWMPGQFLGLTIFGVGEAPFSISSSPTQGILEICVRAVGSISYALSRLKEGSKVGIRGPFGNTFIKPIIEQKNLVLVAGGIGLVPLRSAINYILGNRDNYKKIYILYGTRDPTQIIFKDEIKKWEEREDIEFHLTVDRGSPEADFGQPDPDGNWKGNVGVVTTLFPMCNFPPENIVGFIVGPPVMFKFVVKEFEKIKVPPSKIIVSLERVMHCGVGKCAHCQIGDILVCKDGPVFTFEELKDMPDAI